MTEQLFALSELPTDEIDDVEDTLYSGCRRSILSNTLKLPTIPDVALKIRRAITDERANSAKISRVVQLDPAITARLVQISNSPLFRGRKKIESCPEALTRLGLRATQDIVTSLSLKSVFKARSRMIRTRMRDLWAHSSYVAAISAVLAHKTPGFDPDRAMLAGLIHGIGVVPVLTYADRNPMLTNNPEDIDNAIHRLRAVIGTMIMRKWNFPADFDDIILNAENWHRDDTPEADYTDVVIISQLHSYIGDIGRLQKLPRMDNLPAYHKRVAGRRDLDMSLNILDEAKDEIRHIQLMLH
ncbi:MAG: HDOD domain-containing protein [Pseudomonadota bacterium]